MKTKTVVKFKRNEKPTIERIVEITKGGKFFLPVGKG